MKTNNDEIARAPEGWRAEEAMADALERHPDCTYADWSNGLTGFFQVTIVVLLWRNEECWANDDPPKYTVEGYAR